MAAITGATGAVYGVRLLEMLRDAAVETHLVISPWGRRTLLHETTYTVVKLKDDWVVHSVEATSSAPVK